MQATQTQTRKGFVSRISIEDRRHTFSNRVLEGIKADRNMVKIHLKTIENFETHGGPDVEYTAQRIQRCQSQIEFLLQRIEQEEKKLVCITNGECDEEIMSSVNSMKDNMKKLSEDAFRKKTFEKERLDMSQVEGTAFYKSERSEQSKERAMERELTKYWSAVDTVPPHILKNIETTPCNRAYKWRGVLFYGKLPEQKPDMIFDKNRDGTYITETTPTSETIFFKDHNKNKSLIRKFKRNVHPRLARPAILTPM